MRKKLEQILGAYDDLTAKMADPAVFSDQKEYARLAKEHRAQTQLAEAVRAYLGVLDGIADAEEMLRSESEAEMRDMAREELEELRARAEKLDAELQVMMLPSDPNDDKNIIVEIRGGAGGQDYEEIADRVYDRIRSRFATELLLDRERMGLLIDG